MQQGTPTRPHVNSSIQSPFSSPGFEFRFKRPSSELSDEAQRIMDQVREQAAKIKVELAAQEAEQRLKDGETDALYGVGGRKIAQAKGKVGRFSDVHMEEFKKMDSIANHPSKFRADRARAVPMTSLPKRKADMERSEAGSLKRTRSEADLQTTGPMLARSKSVKSLRSDADEQASNPAKRVRHNHTQETSAVPPVSRGRECDGLNSYAPSPAIRSNSGIPMLPTHTGITTPTKASLARSTSVKSLKGTSMIPSLVHSPSANTLCSPSKGAKTEGNRNYRNTLAKFATLKGILRKPQPMFSDDPVKVAAGTHLAAPKGSSNLDKALPDLPSPSTPSSEKKHVNFTHSAITKDEQVAALKASRPSHVFELGTPTINYPSLPSSRLLEILSFPSPVKVRASMPGDFTFRADKGISFGPATAGRVNEENATLRLVRQSDASALRKAAAADEREEGLEALAKQLPCVPHGLPNKKRRYSMVAEEDEMDEGKENSAREESEEAENPKKRVKSSTGGGSGAGYGVFGKGKGKGAGESRIPRKGRGVLSLSRLNALARPKERR